MATIKKVSDMGQEPDSRVTSINPVRMQGSAQSMGATLIAAGRLTREDAECIARLQQKESLRFGEAGITLGLLTDADVDYVLSRQYAYPTLIGDAGSALSSELIAAFAPFSTQVESLRALRSRLLLHRDPSETTLGSLAIVGPQRGDGRSHLAANLAIVFSQLGEKTLLLDADMRNPRLHQLFGLGNGTGLSSILSGRGSGDVLQHIAGLNDLAVLPAGPQPPNPQELLGRSRFPELMGRLETEYDVILIDTPAGEVYADAQSVCVHAAGAIMTTRKDHTELDSAIHMTTTLQRLGVRILGGVLSDF